MVHGTKPKRITFIKLGTKYGLFKGWFSSDCLKKSTTKFGTTDQVDKNVEFSVREMIKKNFRQGFLSCSCKAKTPCQSSNVHVLKTTSYIKANVIINGRAKINNRYDRKVIIIIIKYSY